MDNNPTSWPPPAKTKGPEPIKTPVNTKAGRVSLILSVSLIAAIIFRHFSLLEADMAEVDVAAYLLPSLLVLLAWSISGVFFGIMGRRSLSGKVGLFLSAVLLLFLLAWIILGWVGSNAH
jgi:hypothetical protein